MVGMTEASELTDDGLVRRILAGDEGAFGLLYKRRQSSIYRFALHMSGNTAIAEDVTQEVFMALIRDASRFDSTKGTVAGFLFGIARNHLRKRWEQDRRLVPLIETADGHELPGIGENGNGTRIPREIDGHAIRHYALATSRDEIAAIETTSRVRQAIDTLPENYREVVVLCELQEMSYEKAASALGCPVGTVRSRLHRARGILLEKLRDAQPARRASVGE